MSPLESAAVHTVPMGEKVQLEAVAEAKLAVDAAEMIAQGVLAHAELPGELPVVGAGIGTELCHDIALPRSERDQQGILGFACRHAVCPAELDEYAARHAAVEPQLALMDPLDGLQQQFRGLFLAHHAPRATQHRGLVRS